MMNSEHAGMIERGVAALAENPSIEGIPEEFLSIGLPGGAADLNSYDAIAAVQFAITAATGLPGLGSAFAARQLIARFFIDGFASGEQKARWIPELVRGALWPAIAISEPNVGAHPKHLSTHAKREGDSYILNGRKSYVTNGARADVILVLAVCKIVEGRKSYGLFAVPKKTPGLDVQPMAGLAALAPSSHAELILTDCRVPASDRLGDAGDAYASMALPFRDTEDAVAVSGLCGLVHWLVRTLIEDLPRTDENLLRIGRLAGLLELARAGAIESARRLTAGGSPVPLGIGIRALMSEIVTELGRDPPNTNALTQDRVRQALSSFDLMIGLARKPRAIRQSNLGKSFLERH